MKILLAPDKFKHSLSAQQVSQVVAEGIRQFDPHIQITMLPMADGGDGSLDVLSNAISCKKIVCTVKDPIGRPIETYYLASQSVAYIELAKASGIRLLKKEEYDPLFNQTTGTGQLVKDAIERGYQEIHLFVGGSATNDAGVGIAEILGFRFLDEHDEILDPVGASLNKISYIYIPKEFDYKDLHFIVHTDVVNVLHGPDGAAHQFAKQKGADPMQIDLLDKGLQHFAQIVQSQLGVNIAGIKGGGAAGGIAAGLVGLLQAEIIPGIEFMARKMHIDEAIDLHDLVISGEGQLDSTSFSGKVVGYISDQCAKYQKPLHLLVGKSVLDSLPNKSIRSIRQVMDQAEDENDALNNAELYLRGMAYELVRSI